MIMYFKLMYIASNILLIIVFDFVEKLLNVCFKLLGNALLTVG